jgi:macrodomain Ter protein organizer (MatP/YcbG family)
MERSMVRDGCKTLSNSSVIEDLNGSRKRLYNCTTIGDNKSRIDNAFYLFRVRAAAARPRKITVKKVIFR